MVCYKECDHDHITLYPPSTVDKAMGFLIYHRDIPIVIDGYEDEKIYKALLCETSNIHGRTKRLDLKAKFNVLPIFLCPSIQSQQKNIFSMDLTNMNIEDEYIELILENKQRLGSWAYELINDAESSFDRENATEYPVNLYRALFPLSNQEDDIPLLYGLDDYINRLRTKWRTNLTSKDITNIGSLAYFFSHYMKVFRRSYGCLKERLLHIRISRKTVRLR